MLDIVIDDVLCSELFFWQRFYELMMWRYKERLSDILL
jgi:hypothetical protein